MNTNLFLLLMIITLFACSDDMEFISDCPDVEVDTRFFEFQSDGGLTFIAWTSDASVIEDVENELALPFDERTKHINGKILRNEFNCEVNGEWSWYFDPSDWALTDFSIELCDGNPQYVEENVSEYVDVIGRYCPWGSKVFQEISPPF